MGAHGYIPIVYPTDSDYEAEKVQSIAGTYGISEDGTKSTAQRYDHWKYLSVVGEKDDLERELASTRRELLDREFREAKMAKDLYEDWVETGMQPARIGKISGIWRYKKWIILGIILLVVIIIFAYGGYLVR
jgi:hypothetical protein